MKKIGIIILTIIILIIITMINLTGCQTPIAKVYKYELDSDNDGLPDVVEDEIKTDKSNKDTDGDGLSDYFESQKYLTNPLENDSDKDGISDYDWEERKEYTYSITAIVDLRPPFNIDHMNDFWQDAKILEQQEDEVTRVEVVLYPEAKEIINSARYMPIDNEYTIPTYSKNYSQKMKDGIMNEVKAVESEYDAAKNLLDLVFKSQYKGIGEELGTDTDLPLQFSIRFNENKEIDYDSIPESTMYSKDQLLERVFFADSMYLNGTRGACGSTATLRGGIMRAAGIQEKCIFTIPLIFSGFDDNVQIDLKSQYKKGYMDGNIVADHVFNEILIGGQWVRVDGDVVGVGYNVGENPHIKILEYNETTEHQFYEYWNYETYSQKRPYKYISVIEQDKKLSYK